MFLVLKKYTTYERSKSNLNWFFDLGFIFKIRILNAGIGSSFGYLGNISPFQFEREILIQDNSLKLVSNLAN